MRQMGELKRVNEELSAIYAQLDKLQDGKQQRKTLQRLRQSINVVMKKLADSKANVPFSYNGSKRSGRAAA